MGGEKARPDGDESIREFADSCDVSCFVIAESSSADIFEVST